MQEAKANATHTSSIANSLQTKTKNKLKELMSQ